MPELRFLIRWPDGTRESCYSPSTVVKDYLRAGETYALADFLDLSRAALLAASERVRARYGAPCSRALDQLDRLEIASRAFRDWPEAHVILEALES
jgi:uncharacterized repeat protein (TIGR04042 family)